MATFYLSAFADEADPSLDGQIAALQRNGIRYIEPRGEGGSGILTRPEADLREMHSRLDAAGITVSSYGSPIGKYPIETDFAPHLADFRTAIRVAKILGTHRIRMFSFYIPQGKLAEYRPEVLRRLTEMLHIATEEGITLCHENEAEIYGQNPDEVEDLLHALPGLLGIFDPANYLMCDADPVRGIDVTLPRLAYVHIKDAVAGEKMIVPAGEGEGQIAEALGKIDRATDRAVILTVEPHLYMFEGYNKIDNRTLHGKYHFNDHNESFDCAVHALETVLSSIGYHKGGDAQWTK